MATRDARMSAEMTRRFDEFVAVEHAAWNASLLSHYQCHDTSARTSRARKEYMSLAAGLRGSIIRSTTTKQHGPISSAFHHGSFEDDLKRAFLAMDVQGCTSSLDENQLTSLLFALIADWRFIPFPGSDEERLAQKAAECALRHVRSDTLSADDFVAWYSDNNEALRQSLKPVRVFTPELSYPLPQGRIRRRVTPYVIADSLCKNRARALARKEELALFRTMFPGSTSGNYYDDTKILSRARQSVERITKIILPRVGQSCSSNQVVPSTEEQPFPDAKPDAGHEKVRLSISRAKNFHFAEQLSREEIIRSVQGWSSSGPTCRDLDVAEHIAQYYARRRHQSLGGKLVVSSEQKRCMALARHLRQQTAVSPSTLKLTVLALPFVVGQGLVEARDVHRILLKNLGIDNETLEVEEVTRASSNAPPGFVLTKDLVGWYASRGHDDSSRRTLLQLSRKSYAQNVIECRARAIGRSELYHATVDKKVYAVRRVLSSWLHRQASATERDALRARVVALADSASTKLRRSRYFRWQSLYCKALETHFRGLAKSFSAQPRLAALKQAEHIFALFDIDGDGVLPIDMLEKILRRFDVALDSSQLFIAQQQVAIGGFFKWMELQTWLLASSFPKIRARLARGWRDKKRHSRKDAMDRVIITGRRRALEQADLMYAIESKWQANCEMREVRSIQEQLEGSDITLSLARAGSAKEPIDMLQSAHDFFFRYFSSPGSDAGTSREGTILSKFKEDVRQLSVQSENVMNQGLENAIKFAHEYCSVRFSLKKNCVGGESGVTYDNEVSQAALKIEELFREQSSWSSDSRREEELPFAWYYWYGETRLLV